MYISTTPHCNAAGSLGPLGQRLRAVTGPAEPDTASESLGQRLASYPGWAHADWVDCQLRPDVRDLLDLAPGPELLSALAAMRSGPCPVRHDGGVSGQPQPGSAPRFSMCLSVDRGCRLGCLCLMDTTAPGSGDPRSCWCDAGLLGARIARVGQMR